MEGGEGRRIGEERNGQERGKEEESKGKKGRGKLLGGSHLVRGKERRGLKCEKEKKCEVRRNFAYCMLYVR